MLSKFLSVLGLLLAAQSAQAVSFVQPEISCHFASTRLTVNYVASSAGREIREFIYDTDYDASFQIGTRPNVTGTSIVLTYGNDSVLIIDLTRNAGGSAHEFVGTLSSLQGEEGSCSGRLLRK